MLSRMPSPKRRPKLEIAEHAASLRRQGLPPSVALDLALKSAGYRQSETPPERTVTEDALKRIAARRGTSVEAQARRAGAAGFRVVPTTSAGERTPDTGRPPPGLWKRLASFTRQRTAAAGWGTAMSRRDWWLGVGLVVAALLFHALFPRYDVRVGIVPVRVDRWTGTISRAMPTNK